MKNSITNVLIMIVGNVILAFGVAMFLLPNSILSGGVAGVTVLMNPFVNLSEDLVVSMITISLFIVGTIFLDKKFAINTAVSTIVFPSCLIVVNRLFEPIVVDQLLAAIYGGLICGVGVGLTFRRGGSTGGMDVPALIANKYFGIDVHKAVMIIDALTVIAGLIIYDVNSVLIGLISVYTTGIGVKSAISFGGVRAKKFEIISNQAIAIKNDIIKMDRGATIVEAKGAFSSDDRTMIVSVVGDNEYQDLLDIIDSHDKQAFVIVSDVKDVRGEGFSYQARI